MSDDYMQNVYFASCNYADIDCIMMKVMEWQMMRKDHLDLSHSCTLSVKENL